MSHCVGKVRKVSKEVRTAVAYLRTSSMANVGEDKDSAKRQREAIAAYAKTAGYVKSMSVDKGDVEFAVGTPSFQFPLFAKGQLPPIVNYYEYTYPYKWDVAVKPESATRWGRGSTCLR